MAKAAQVTLETLRKLRERHASALVAFSGGKDSWVILDLARRSFERVEAFFMYLIPPVWDGRGLEVVETQLDKARALGVRVHQLPHWGLIRTLAAGALCEPPPNHARIIPDAWTIRDVYDSARAMSGIELVLTGAKASDSLWRRRTLAMGSMDHGEIAYPVKGWHKLDVLEYLRARHIELPSSSGRSATGVGLTEPSLLWLHREHPADFRKLCEWFPYAEAVVLRAQLFGEMTSSG